MRLRLFWIASVLGASLLALLLATCHTAQVRPPTGSSDSDSDSDGDSDADADSDSDNPCGLSELETFAGQIPTGWTVVDGGTSAGAWTYTATLPDSFPADITIDGGAFIDSAGAGADAEQDDDLVSPLYDLADCSSAVLSFDHNFQKDLVGTDLAEIYVVPGGGAGTPLLLVSYTTDSPHDGFHSPSLDITASELGDETTFQVVFHYEGGGDLGWYVDNVGVEGVP
jgi:hypothetical protein